jgi:hypothetical protein
VLEHFDDVARNVRQLVRENAPSATRGTKRTVPHSVRLAEAFGFKKPGRSGNRNYLREYWSSSVTYVREALTAAAVQSSLEMQREKGDTNPKLTSAYAFAASLGIAFHGAGLAPKPTASGDSDHSAVRKAWKLHKDKFAKRRLKWR